MDNSNHIFLKLIISIKIHYPNKLFLFVWNINKCDDLCNLDCICPYLDIHENGAEMLSFELITTEQNGLSNLIKFFLI